MQMQGNLLLKMQYLEKLPLSVVSLSNDTDRCIQTKVDKILMDALIWSLKKIVKDNDDSVLHAISQRNSNCSVHQTRPVTLQRSSRNDFLEPSFLYFVYKYSHGCYVTYVDVENW